MHKWKAASISVHSRSTGMGNLQSALKARRVQAGGPLQAILAESQFTQSFLGAIAQSAASINSAPRTGPRTPVSLHSSLVKSMNGSLQAELNSAHLSGNSYTTDELASNPRFRRECAPLECDVRATADYPKRTCKALPSRAQSICSG